MVDETKTTAIELAQSVLATQTEAAEKRKALIDRLLQDRADIDAALEALGAKRRRRNASAEKPKRGRPKGSKNRVAEAEVAAQ